MAVWKSVEKVTVTITDTTPVIVNLTKGQDETQCTPWFSQKHNGSVTDQFNDRMALVEIIDNAGTPAVRVTASARSESVQTLDFEVSVVEWDTSINVQQVTVSDFTGVLTNVTISDVGIQADAFMMYSYQFTDVPSSDDDWADALVQCQFNGASKTSVTLSRRTGDGTVNGVLYVVDCDASEWTVQHIEIDVTTASAISQNGGAFATVIMADTFIIHSYESSHTSDDALEAAWMADLNSATTVRVQRTAGGTPNSTSTHSIAVVTCNGNQWDVQRDAAIAMTAATITDTITAIDQARTFLNLLDCMGHPTNDGRTDRTLGGDNDNSQVALDFTADTTVRFRKLDANRTDDIVSYEVIQFAAGGLTTLNFADDLTLLFDASFIVIPARPSDSKRSGIGFKIGVKM